MSYFKIIPVAGRHHGIYDTITEVANATGMKYGEVLRSIGFESNGELLSYCNQNPNPYFNKSAFLSRRLNEVCKSMHAHIRIIRPYRERSNDEY